MFFIYLFRVALSDVYWDKQTGKHNIICCFFGYDSIPPFTMDDTFPRFIMIKPKELQNKADDTELYAP